MMFNKNLKRSAEDFGQTSVIHFVALRFGTHRAASGTLSPVKIWLSAALIDIPHIIFIRANTISSGPYD